MGAYFEAEKNAGETIMLYETCKFLYLCIINNPQVFDKDGNPRNRENAEENIRIALAGKRKGKTPVEILTGKKQEKDWLEMLLERVEGDNILSIAA